MATSAPPNCGRDPSQVVHSEWRKRRRSEDSASNVQDEDGADANDDSIICSSVTASSFKSPGPISRFHPLSMISIALSSMLFALDSTMAVEPPNAPSAPRDRGLTPNWGSRSEANHRGDVTDERPGRKNVQPIRSSGDGPTPRETERMTHRGDDDNSSPPHEPKANKLKQHMLKVRAVGQQQSTTPLEQNAADFQSSRAEYDAYMHWCEKVLGIQSVVEIREFEYLDHLKLHWDEKAREEFYDPRGFDWLRQYADSVEDDGSRDAMPPTKLVRGLAAKYDVQPGDIVISIPLYSLLSVPTTIDHDPVLSRILGPDARRTYGWADTSEYELQLLVLAVLYHRSLGDDSPMAYYVDVLLGTPTDSFPFLWSDRELNEKVRDEGVKTMARSVRLHLYEMYDEIIGTLVKAKPEWFAPPGGHFSKQQTEGSESDWAYSYENFQWAFAMVISRHHYLPIHDFDDNDEDAPKPTKQTLVKRAGSPSKKQIMHETLSSVSEVAPPANQRKFSPSFWSRGMHTLQNEHFSRIFLRCIAPR
jgi:hypothetical protein